MPSPLVLTIATLAGHALGALWLWWTRRMGKQAQARAEKAEAFAALLARAIESQKDLVKASGSKRDAVNLRALTRGIAKEAVSLGLEVALQEFLQARGLNVTPKLSRVLGADHG